jgi:hypothetical protein
MEEGASGTITQATYVSLSTTPVGCVRDVGHGKSAAEFESAGRSGSFTADGERNVPSTNLVRLMEGEMIFPIPTNDPLNTLINTVVSRVPAKGTLRTLKTDVKLVEQAEDFEVHGVQL